MTAVDKSASTTMCVLALGNSLAAQWGPRLAAERVLPALAPLLVVPTLNSQQFATAMKTVRDVLSHVERSRAAGGADGSPHAGSLGGMAPAAGGGRGAMAGGTAKPAAAAAAVDSDWMAAAVVGPASGSRAMGSMGPPAAAPVPAAPAANGTDLLAGLTLQQPPAATAVLSRLPAPSAGASSSSSSSMFGLAGQQVGSGKPIGSLQPVATSAQPSWAFGGTSAVGGAAAMRPAPASSLADPFAGLQLGGATGNALRPAAVPQQQQQQQQVFDPFALGSAAPGGSPQWPARVQQQAAMQPPAGGFAAGADGSLI